MEISPWKQVLGGGLVSVTIASLAPNTAPAFAEFFERAVRPVLEQAGARTIAMLTTEQSANTFPRLPVREAETVFVWFSVFASAQAYARHLELLGASSLWADGVEPELQQRIWRNLEVSRLAPIQK